MKDDANVAAVFFDLDGTLVDTAPDMVAALRSLQRQHSRSPIDYAQGRLHVSNGALGLLRAGFPDLSETERTELVPDFLALYAPRVAKETNVFDGLDSLLDKLDSARLSWGIVTNKPGWLTDPLLDELKLADRCAAVVSGDTLPTRKPHPDPLYHACDLAGVVPQHCIYVGDARRDIEAGKAAGMKTIAAAWGYIVDGDSAEDWEADLVAQSPAELTQILVKAVNLSS